MPELWQRPATELVALVKRSELSAEEVAQSFLARCAEADAATNCFVTLEAESALATARRLDDSPPSAEAAPLLGLPYAVKDVFATESGAPRAGAPHPALTLRANAATSLERLEKAGAIGVGRLNLDPWAYAATGVNPHFGDTLNPWNPAHLAGGSSSGAAAAVAARAVPVALGTDTGGSVRIPAAMCGVTGLKPTFGRLSRRGTIPLSFSQDTVGVLANSAQDIALVLSRLAGYDPLDPASIDAPRPQYLAGLERSVAAGDRPLRGVRVGVHPEGFQHACDPAIEALAEAALAVLSDAGATLVELDLACLRDFDVAASVLTQAESASIHRAAVGRAPEDYAPAVRARIWAGLGCQGSDHVDALRYQGVALRQLLDGPLSQADLLAVPVTGRTAPGQEEVQTMDTEQAVSLSVSMLSLNRPFNLVGTPALSLPIGFCGDRLPAGLQLVGRPWSEARLLQVAAVHQAATDWHLRIPKLPGSPTERGDLR